MSDQKIWTEEETGKLVVLSKSLTAAQIGSELGRTKDSVRHRLRWLKDQNRVLAPVVKAKEDQEGKALRKKEYTHVSYPPLEWCPTCHSPVSNWSDHTSRLGCRRPL